MKKIVIERDVKAPKLIVDSAFALICKYEADNKDKEINHNYKVNGVNYFIKIYSTKTTITAKISDKNG